MSDNSFDAAQKALRNRAVVDLEEPLPEEQPVRWWLRILVVLVFFGFGAIVWLSWQDNAGDGNPMLVAAPTEPVKEKPAEEGGLAAPNQGTTIPDVLAGGETGTRAEPPPEVGPVEDSIPLTRPIEVIPPTDVKELADGPEAARTTVPLGEIRPSAGPSDGTAPPAGTGPPVSTSPLPDTAPQVPGELANAGSSDLVTKPLQPIEGAPSAPVTTTPVVPAPPATTVPPATGTPQPATPPSTPTAPDGPQEIVPPAPPAEPVPPSIDTGAVPERQEPIAPPKPIQAPKVATPPPATQPPRIPNGVRIQVASLRSEAAAKTAYASVRQKNGDVLDGLRPVVVRAEVKGSTYYRAQAEGFASRTAAQAACAKIKSRGADCLVVAR